MATSLRSCISVVVMSTVVVAISAGGAVAQSNNASPKAGANRPVATEPVDDDTDDPADAPGDEPGDEPGDDPGREEAFGSWTSTGHGPGSWQQPGPAVSFDASRTVGPTITIDPDQRYQTHHGTGVALTESSASLLAGLPDQVRRAAIEHVFIEQGISLVRIPLGASDFSLSHAPTEGTYLDTFGDLEPGRAEQVLQVAREIREVRGDVTFIGAAWSAPAGMKTSGSLYGGTLRQGMHAAYGEYLLEVADHYAASGVPLRWLSLGNEPRHEPHDYPGMRLSATQATALAQWLEPHLAARGLELQGLDHNAADVPHAMSLLDDSRVEMIGLHCYDGPLGLATLLTERHPHVSLMMTECTSGGWATDRNANLRWDVRDLLIGGGKVGSTGTVKWNLALDPSGGPHVGGCQDCTGVLTVDGTEVTADHDLYALGHLSRFVAPGARRFAVEDAGTSGIQAVGYTSGDAHSVLLVHDGGRDTTATLQWGERRAHVRLPAHSVVTLRFPDAETSIGTPAAPNAPTVRATRAGAALSWGFVPGASAYEVQRADSAKGPWTTVARVGGVTHQDRPSSDGTFHYRLRARTTETTSSWSKSTAVSLHRGLTDGLARSASTFDAQQNTTSSWCGHKTCPIRIGMRAGSSLDFAGDNQQATRLELAVASEDGGRVQITTRAGELLGTAEVVAGATRVTVPLAQPPRDGIRVTLERGALEVEWVRAER